MTGFSYSPARFSKRASIAATFLLLSAGFGAFAGESPAPAQQQTPAPAAPAAPPAPAAPATPQSEAARARAAAVAAKANIDIGEGWARASGQDGTASVFMTITSVKDADRLVAVETAIANTIELKDVTTENGTTKTNTVEGLDIPAGRTIDFKAGGRALLLSGLKAPLLEGEAFMITFRFDKAGTQTLPVKVLSTSATGLPPLGSSRKGDTTAAVTQR